MLVCAAEVPIGVLRGPVVCDVRACSLHPRTLLTEVQLSLIAQDSGHILLETLHAIRLSPEDFVPRTNPTTTWRLNMALSQRSVADFRGP